MVIAILSDTMRLMAVLAKTSEVDAGMTAYRTVKDWEKSNEPKEPEYYFAVARALMDLSLDAVTEILITTNFDEKELIMILTVMSLRSVDAKTVTKHIMKERNRRN